MPSSNRSRPVPGFRGIIRLLIIIPFLAASLLVVGAQSVLAEEEGSGVRVSSIRLGAAGHLVDFRYRVIDPEKNPTLLDPALKAYLIDQKTGREFPVMKSKIGPLRSTAVKPQAGRQYVILFSNDNRVISKGSKVTVVMGDFKVENLTVE